MSFRDEARKLLVDNGFVVHGSIQHWVRWGSTVAELHRSNDLHCWFSSSGAQFMIGDSRAPENAEWGSPAVHRNIRDFTGYLHIALVEQDRTMESLSGFGATKAEIPEVEFRHWIEPEEVSIRGNVMDSGDAEADREQEQWVRAQLRAGNEAAWAFAMVTAKVSIPSLEEHRFDYELEGRAGLGACSYNSEVELWEDNLESMEAEAVTDLLAKLRALAESPTNAWGVSKRDREHLSVILDGLLEKYGS